MGLESSVVPKAARYYGAVCTQLSCLHLQTQPLRIAYSCVEEPSGFACAPLHLLRLNARLLSVRGPQPVHRSLARARLLPRSQGASPTAPRTSAGPRTPWRVGQLLITDLRRGPLVSSFGVDVLARPLGPGGGGSIRRPPEGSRQTHARLGCHGCPPCNTSSARPKRKRREPNLVRRPCSRQR